ncbi:MAG: hypothetical protein ACKOSQ_09520 [Planctomycetaceae bacterium]
MTSPSPTSRRTTRRRSIRERAAPWPLFVAAAAIATAPVAMAGWRDLQRSEPPPAVVAPVVSGAVPVPMESEPERLGRDVEEPGDTATADGAGDVLTVAAESPAEPPAADDGEGPCGTDVECRDALAKLRSDSLTGIDLDIRVGGRPGSDYPCECRLEGDTFQPRQFATTMFTWKAAGYCHKPLYFEHWTLERYGHSHGFAADTFLSAVHFFARVPALPYQMGVELPWECVYPLGYYRPGSCAPWTVPAVPISCRGLALEAAAATGIVFILP